MTDETNANEVMMMGCRAKSPYMQTATKAAKLEREGALEAAGKLWGHAAVEAVREENKVWALARQERCDPTMRRGGKGA
ncbi:ANR family transcriptional regulator [Aeromonas veronii]|uniref:ANR family transcriptional regulator n=1 Tax=Aeromonas veronii TaxID=654 RepID=A0A3A9I5P7_AERVE|nr:ANR family transcriptional regulator [Aeromonas veronii]RKJ83791.1 ANR family transcriptional regulator [Aeromonas veronii]